MRRAPGGAGHGETSRICTSWFVDIPGAGSDTTHWNVTNAQPRFELVKNAHDLHNFASQDPPQTAGCAAMAASSAAIFAASRSLYLLLLLPRCCSMVNLVTGAIAPARQPACMRRNTCRVADILDSGLPHGLRYQQLDVAEPFVGIESSRFRKSWTAHGITCSISRASSLNHCEGGSCAQRSNDPISSRLSSDENEQRCESQEKQREHEGYHDICPAQARANENRPEIASCFKISNLLIPFRPGRVRSRLGQALNLPEINRSRSIRSDRQKSYNRSDRGGGKYLS